MVSVTESLHMSAPGARVTPACPLNFSVLSLVAMIELFVERKAICTAPIVSVFVANLFVSFTRTLVPPSFEKTLRRNVWLLKDGVDWTAPFTFVDRNEAAQLSTHVSVVTLSISGFATVLYCCTSFATLVLLHAPKKIIDTTMIIEAATLLMCVVLISLFFDG